MGALGAWQRVRAALEAQKPSAPHLQFMRFGDNIWSRKFMQNGIKIFAKLKIYSELPFIEGFANYVVACTYSIFQQVSFDI